MAVNEITDQSLANRALVLKQSQARLQVRMDNWHSATPATIVGLFRRGTGGRTESVT